MIRTEKSHLKTTAGTHAGMSGKNNEDSYGVSAYILEDENSTPALLAVLADGIGGHSAGEVASALVVNTISQKVSQSDASDPQTILKDAIHAASRQVQKIAKSDDRRKGMGSTVVCAWIIGKRLYTAYVGDSRIYLVRGGQIFRLTHDHSWIQEALDSGLLTPEQATGHPNSHVIRRYVGSSEPPDVDFRLRLDPAETAQQSIANQGLVLKNGDRLLLCSDGLTDLMQDDEILSVMTGHPAEDAVDHLIDSANQRGGHDNITAVIIQVPEGVFAEGRAPGGRNAEKSSQPTKTALPVRTLTLGCLGTAAAIILLAGGFFVLRYLNENRGASTPTISESVTAPEGAIQESLTAISSSLPGILQTGITPDGAVPAAENTQTSGGSNIAPPPNPQEMTAVPTHTPAPTGALTQITLPHSVSPAVP